MRQSVVFTKQRCVSHYTHDYTLPHTSCSQVIPLILHVTLHPLFFPALDVTLNGWELSYITLIGENTGNIESHNHLNATLTNRTGDRVKLLIYITEPASCSCKPGQADTGWPLFIEMAELFT